MKRIFIITAFRLCLPLVAEINTTNIQNLLDEGIIEKVSQSFSSVPGSSRYIKKFKLNKKEIELIGQWGFDGIINKVPNNREYGPGISITFYPNRFFSIYREFEKENQIKNIIGEWKVENNILLIRLRAKIVIENSQSDSLYKKYKVVNCDSIEYYPLFVVPAYDVCFINTQAFDWSKIPLRLRNFYEIENTDKPRSRLLFDSLGIPPGNIQEGSTLDHLLYNPEITDKYFIDLAHNAW